jgi:predicted dehydrogenase
MTRKIGVGLIGCGSLSLIGILPQLALPDAREQIDLVAVCDVVGERARATAERFGVPRAYTDAADLIADPGVELVLVITPIRFHHPYAMAALRAGKHVYVQKTMAMTYAEAKEMVEAARERGLVLVAAPGQMLNAANVAIKQLVDDGALGDVYWAWGSTGGWYHNEPTRQGDDVMTAVDPSWYYRSDGGPLRDVTVYVLHTLTGVLGPAQRVSAMSGIRVPERQWRDKRIELDVDDNSLLMLDFGGARFAVAGGHASRTGPLLQWGSLGVYGSGGAVETLEIEPLSGHPTKFHVRAAGKIDPVWLTPLGDDAYAPAGWLAHVDAAHQAVAEPHVYADIMHAVDCIRSGRPPVASGEHAAHVVEIIEKGYEAARTGQTQRLESSFALPL